MSCCYGWRIRSYATNGRAAPTRNAAPPAVKAGWSRHPKAVVVVLGATNVAFVGRVTRSTMLEVLREDYIRTARSKGLAEWVVIYRHALKNALLPVVTVSGYQFGSLLGGTIIIENIYLIPGWAR